jgi:hypothetical protein
VPHKLDIEQVKAILTDSDLVVSWQALTEEETAHRAVYRIRCHLLRAAYQLEIRFIQTEDETIYSYQLFTNKPIIRWDNAPHFPALRSFPYHIHGESDEVKESPLIGDPIQDLPYVLDQTRAFLTRPTF